MSIEREAAVAARDALSRTLRSALSEGESDNIRELCVQSLSSLLDGKAKVEDRGVLGEVSLIEPSLRADLWAALLECSTKEPAILATEVVSRETAVIQQDCLRCRADDPTLNTAWDDDSLSTVRSIMENVLNCYCVTRGIGYKQGLCHLLAPILIVYRNADSLRSPTDNLGAAFNCFYSLIERFLPCLFADNEYESLQGMFSMFHVLLLYHDPELERFLVHHAATPELYLPGWVLTMFAHKLGSPSLLPSLLLLWDLILLENDPVLPLFMCVSLLMANRSQLLEAEPEDLVMRIVKFPLQPQDVVPLFTQARILRKRTPLSFRQNFTRVCLRPEVVTTQGGISGTGSTPAACMEVTPSELLRSFQPEMDEDQLRYVILDVRSPCTILRRGKIEANDSNLTTGTRGACGGGHLFGSLFLHDLLQFARDPEKLYELLASSQPETSNGTHVCVLGPGFPGTTVVPLSRNFEPVLPAEQSPNHKASEMEERKGVLKDNSDKTEMDLTTSLFVHLLLRQGFQHVSYCKGGYRACHNHLQLEHRYGTVLKDHDPSACPYCRLPANRNDLGGTSDQLTKQLKSPPSVQQRSTTGRLMSLSSTAIRSLWSGSGTTQNRIEQLPCSCLTEDSPTSGSTLLSAARNALAPPRVASPSHLQRGQDILTQLENPRDGGEVEFVIDLLKWAAEEGDGDDVHFFECFQVTRDETTQKLCSRKRIIALTPGYFLLFEPKSDPVTNVANDEQEDKGSNVQQSGSTRGGKVCGWAVLRSRKKLILLEQISSRKKKPEMLTFFWKNNSQASSPAKNLTVQILVVPKYRECAKAVETNYSKLPGKTPSGTTVPSTTGDDLVFSS